MKPNEKNLELEYRQFLNLKTDEASDEVLQKLTSQVHEDLNPTIYVILAIIAGVQSVAGTLSLSLCNQFGMNPFNSPFSLSEYFMMFGHTFCMFCCGIIFLSVGPLIAGIILSRDQVRVLRKNIFIFIPILAIASLFTFSLLGAYLDWGTTAVWILGALIGGIASTELNYRITFRTLR